MVLIQDGQIQIKAIYGCRRPLIFALGWFSSYVVTLHQRHRLFSVKYMNMVMHGDLEGPEAKRGHGFFDVPFPNSRTGPKKTSNKMVDELRKTPHMYLRLISNRQLNQKFVTLRAYRISAVTCWLLGVKNWVPSAGSQSAPERNGNEQVFLQERGLSLPFPFRQCFMLIYHKVPCPNIN